MTDWAGCLLSGVVEVIENVLEVDVSFLKCLIGDIYFLSPRKIHKLTSKYFPWLSKVYGAYVFHPCGSNLQQIKVSFNTSPDTEHVSVFL